MFDGTFKSKNTISLRGNSKKEDKAALMRKAREERKARLQQRARREGSQLIQVRVEVTFSSYSVVNHFSHSIDNTKLSNKLKMRNLSFVPPYFTRNSIKHKNSPLAKFVIF